MFKLFWVLLLAIWSGILDLYNRARGRLVDQLLRRAFRKYGRVKGNVRRLTGGLVLKVTPTSRSRVEVEATRFIKTHTTLPVPRLWYYWEEGERGLQVMDYREGVMLQRAWHTLSDPQRRHVMHRLKGFVEELRSIPQPLPPPGAGLPSKSWVGSPLGNAFMDFRMTDSNDPFGPFPNEALFNDWKVSRFALFGQVHPPTADRIAALRHAMPDDHPIVFTHGDINRRNVLVHVHGEGPEDVEVTALLDWEQAGWRPVHWESVKWRFETGPEFDWGNFALDEIATDYEVDVQREEELQAISGHTPP